MKGFIEVTSRNGQRIINVKSILYVEPREGVDFGNCSLLLDEIPTDIYGDRILLVKETLKEVRALIEEASK